ncbi:iron complex outermembrane recepter protein [Sunxiuqinia elliptica]|uniref:Iron complex outermembrane recepter protein n=2 Tax=Sunxiuqinia elliptica TaxID=655355 RepID=A0A1I2MAM5_9BACT|nr:iron complex outermembrane recepter protein [Sunxiuqinia elliptica]
MCSSTAQINLNLYFMRKIILTFMSTVCLALLLIGQTHAQMSVSGTVRDVDGGEIPGVTVLEKGTTNGTVTDMEGRYTLQVSMDAVLAFSFVGMTTKEIRVDGRESIDVQMDAEEIGIDEVVVTALGIKKEAKALGYAVSKVSSERILASGTPTNALQSLYGSAAGVQVAATATGPTGGMKINIRNAVSFDANSSTRPLIVVDGVPIHDENTGIGYNNRSGRDNGTGINDINPDDIASFEILKGAKASVLYGSEGANGVVLITTKSGARGQGLGVSASFTTSWDNIAFMPDLQDQYGTGRSPSNTQTDDQGYYLDDEGQRALDYSGGAFGPKFDPNVSLVWWDGSTRPWVAQNKTIYEQLFQQGRQNTTNVALSSGGDKGSMRFSYTNMQLTPTTPGGEYDRNTFSINSTYDINDYITVKYAGNYYVSKNQNGSSANSFDAQGARSSLGAYSADIDVDLLEQYLVTEDGYNYFSNPDLQYFISTGRSSIVGSLWDWSQDESVNDRIHNIQSLTLDVKLSKTFGATIMGGLDNTNERSIYRGKLRDPSLAGPGSGSIYRDVSRQIRKSYGQGMFNFDTNVSEVNISGFVGGVIRHNYLEQKGAEVVGGMVIPNFFSFSNLPSGVQPQYVNNNEEDILYSVLGSVQGAWNDQVYVEAQARQDWSSILPVDNNSYFYPGLSATWIASNSLELPYWVEFAKLRASWADVGRPGPRYFSNVNYEVSASGSGYILAPPGELPPMDENFKPNLKPERKREFEVGLEAYMFKNQRIGVDFSFYTSNTYDQIMAVAAPPGLGVSKIRMNAANVENTGWELAIKTKPIHTRDFKWNVDLTFASSKTKVKELGGGLTSLSLWGTNGLNAVAEVGGEYGLIYQQKGWQHYINPSDPNDPKNGQRVVSSNGASYNYASSSTKMVGKLIPDVTGGLFTSFSYKNLRLIANMDYSFGAFFISEGETYMMAAGVLKESLAYRDQASGGIAYHLDETGTKVKGEHPSGGATYYDGVLLDGVLPNGETNDKVVAAEDYYGESYFSNGFFPEDRLFKSDYIALRNIALDYTLPIKLTQKIGVNGLTVSVFANNVAYLYKDAPNTIPESSNGTGWNDSSYGTTALPAQRSIGMSLKVKL